jgi:hypothetical protein
MNSSEAISLTSIAIISVVVMVAALGSFVVFSGNVNLTPTSTFPIRTITSTPENPNSTSNSSAVSNSEWHFEANISQNESGITVQSNLTSIVNRTRTAIFGDPVVIVVIKQLNGTIVYLPVITALARIVNVSFDQSFVSTQQIQVALQAHQIYVFVIAAQVGDNSTSGAPGVNVEFIPLFSETIATASNPNPVTSSTINPAITSSQETVSQSTISVSNTITFVTKTATQ